MTRLRTPLRQSGATLLIVMVMLLLAALVVLASTRGNWLNDKLITAEADRQRAFLAAEALVRDAELDIRGLRVDGNPCPTPSGTAMGCRSRLNGMGFFPLELDDFDLIQALVAGQPDGCIRGLCVPAAPDALTDALGTAAGLERLKGSAALYGQFTGADGGAAGHPLLNADSPSGWYWVEVLHYSAASLISAGSQGLPVPDPAQPFVYRIHAVVEGLREGTQVHLVSVLVPRPLP